MHLAPIILFVYKRPEHTKKTIESLIRNTFAKESKLYIYSDNAKTSEDRKLVDEVRGYIESVKGFKEINVIKREKHFDLADSVITGVTEVLKKHKKAIVMEDDLITSVDFLKFTNEALDFYENNQSIYSITGYGFPIDVHVDYDKDFYIFPRASSWGWATWLNRWEKTDWKLSDFESFKYDKNMQKQFNFGGNDLSSMLMAQKYGYINSWAVRWSYNHYKNNAYCLYPVISRIKNIGFDNSATHKVKTSKFENEISQKQTDFEFSNDFQTNEKIFSKINHLFTLSPIRRAINYFKYYILH